MKKMLVLLAALMMTMSMSVWAADGEVNPKLEKAELLRVQAAKASLEAKRLLKEASDLELEAKQPLAGEKMRGGNYSCWKSCWDNGSGANGNNFTCERLCGYH